VGHLAKLAQRASRSSRKTRWSRLTVTGGRAHATRGWANLSSRRETGERSAQPVGITPK
jgi:hypothetical protein